MHEEEIEITLNKDGTTTIKVIRSKRPCHEVTKPLEVALGTVIATKQEHNPGTSVGNQVQA